jgi:hypothetical protein
MEKKTTESFQKAANDNTPKLQVAAPMVTESLV